MWTIHLKKNLTQHSKSGRHVDIAINGDDIQIGTHTTVEEREYLRTLHMNQN